MLTEMELARHNLHAKAHIMNNVQNEIKEGEVSEGDSDSDVDSSDKDDISLSNTYVTNELTMITSRRERKATKRLSLWEKTKIKRTHKGAPCTIEKKGGASRETLCSPNNPFIIKIKIKNERSYLEL
jgi:hypothetical protein